MPIVTHEDSIALAKLDVEIADMIRKIASKINSLSSKEKDLGNSYQEYTKILAEYARKSRDKSKQMEVLAHEERSGVEDGEVSSFKAVITHTEESLKKLENYYDRMKDLAVHKESLISKMDEYAGLLIENAKIRKRIVDLGLKIEKEKNKMVAADSLSKLEDSMKDIEREFERSKKELEKKWEQVEQERSEINNFWVALKGAVDKFE